MQKLLCLTCGLLCVLTSLAQNGRYSSLRDFSKIKNSTLLVVLYEDDDLYNNSIREIIETHWKATPYQFVDTLEFYDIVKSKGDTQYSMLVRNQALRIVNRVNGSDNIQSNHLAIYLIDKGNDLRNYTGKDALTQFRFHNVKNTLEYYHKLPALIKYMHLYMGFVEEKNPGEDNHEKLLRQFNSQHTERLKDYTLYLVKEEMPEDIELEEIQELYPYALEFVETDRLLSAVKNEEEKIAFLHLDPRIKQITVIEAANGEILYLSRTSVSGELNYSDFKKISRAASGGKTKKKPRLLKRLKNIVSDNS